MNYKCKKNPFWAVFDGCFGDFGDFKQLADTEHVISY